MHNARIAGAMLAGLLTGALGVAGIHAAGAQTAPAPSKPPPAFTGLPVNVVNTPLPVTGSVNVAGQVTVGGNVSTQAALPARGFVLQTSPRTPAKTLGPNPSTQQYVISSISFVDSDSVPEAGLVFVATGTTADCANFRQLTVTASQRVEALPHTTVQLTFPQPLVLGAGECLVAAGGNNTDITVIGYLLS